ncbi:hypothetical protein EWM64_g718 [Hericium alpestre]|uniref:Autophagy-related protein 17 n=1 Tax=Hericium alpestre TaxID=135208 RepID=A0A4Z0A883_9AGAM|nr:hypothetical protein EWM64_g718 [Hericium alpestre]
MSQSPQAQTEQTELASLVLHSKTALQQGEALCLRASSSSNASAQDAFDLLALNARVRWISDAVIEQLKLAASVAKTIEERRTKLEKQTQDWDTVRAQWTTSLDTLLESLGSQVVPPDFHDSMSDSSIFGSQFSEPEMDHSNHTSEPGHSPTLTIRHTNGNGRHKSKKDKDLNDRTRWKTLRDFVDERAIEDAIETIEAERVALDDVLASTADYPSTLHDTLSTIRDALPRACQSIRVDEVLTKQEDLSATMAEQLESLAEHYDKMEGALQEHEAGEVFGEDDLQDMQRDTNELPAIVSELDESCAAIERRRDELLSAKHEAEHSLEILCTTLDNLDELGDIMGEMLEQQQRAENGLRIYISIYSSLKSCLIGLRHIKAPS